MGLSVKCLGSRPTVGKHIQVHAEAFDTGMQCSRACAGSYTSR